MGIEHEIPRAIYRDIRTYIAIKHKKSIFIIMNAVRLHEIIPKNSISLCIFDTGFF